MHPEMHRCGSNFSQPSFCCYLLRSVGRQGIPIRRSVPWRPLLTSQPRRMRPGADGFGRAVTGRSAPLTQINGLRRAVPSTLRPRAGGRAIREGQGQIVRSRLGLPNGSLRPSSCCHSVKGSRHRTGSKPKPIPASPALLVYLETIARPDWDGARDRRWRQGL